MKKMIVGFVIGILIFAFALYFDFRKEVSLTPSMGGGGSPEIGGDITDGSGGGGTAIQCKQGYNEVDGWCCKVIYDHGNPFYDTCYFPDGKPSASDCRSGHPVPGPGGDYSHQPFNGNGKICNAKSIGTIIPLSNSYIQICEECEQEFCDGLFQDFTYKKKQSLSETVCECKQGGANLDYPVYSWQVTTKKIKTIDRECETIDNKICIDCETGDEHTIEIKAIFESSPPLLPGAMSSGLDFPNIPCDLDENIQDFEENPFTEEDLVLDCKPGNFGDG